MEAAIRGVFAAARGAGAEAELEARFSVGAEAYGRVIAVLDGGVSWDSRYVRDVSDHLFEDSVRVRHTGALREAQRKEVLTQVDVPAHEVARVAGLSIGPLAATVRFQAARERPVPLPTAQAHSVRQKRTHSYVYKGTWRFDVSLVNDERVELEVEAIADPGPEGVRSMCMKVCDLLQMAYGV